MPYVMPSSLQWASSACSGAHCTCHRHCQCDTAAHCLAAAGVPPNPFTPGTCEPVKDFTKWSLSDYDGIRPGPSRDLLGADMDVTDQVGGRQQQAAAGSSQQQPAPMACFMEPHSATAYVASCCFPLLQHAPLLQLYAEACVCSACAHRPAAGRSRGCSHMTVEQYSHRTKITLDQEMLRL